MRLTKLHIEEALSAVSHPSGSDLVSEGCIREVKIDTKRILVQVSIPQAKPSLTHEQLRKLSDVIDASIKATAQEQGASGIILSIEFINQEGELVMNNEHNESTPTHSNNGTDPAPAERTMPLTQCGHPLPCIKNLIAVGAGKGGVGKSTVSVALAVGLARKGYSVGLLDGDIYGPSLATMMGISPEMKQAVIEGYLQPFNVHGVKSITMGKLVDPDEPLIWRGAMAHSAFNQLIHETNWGDLDYLIIDLPPGTGDIPLTLAQSVQLTGAVIVSTPQMVAQNDAVRASAMFDSLNVDVLGVVENMSYFVADDQKEYDIFGRGGAETMAKNLGHPFLGAIPINMALRDNCDSGKPIASFNAKTAGGSQLPMALTNLVDQLESQVDIVNEKSKLSKPTLTVT
jgi:ATP-binding protein involved in chromosome partitioning